MSSNSGSGRDRNSEMPTEKKGKADPLRDEKDESVLQGSEDDEPAGVEEQDSLVADAENETERDQAARDAAESSSGVESQGSKSNLSRKR